MHGSLFQIVISCVVCDAPARSFVKAVKGHAGYFGCERCKQEGEWDNRLFFPDMDSPLRHDCDFDEIGEDDPHIIGHSPFRELGIGLVSSFVLDYMHLVCLGVMKKLL